MERSILVEQLHKSYRTGWGGARVRALQGIDFETRPGQVVGLLGPNGSGKSTTLRILLGLTEPDSGRALIFGQPGDRAESRRQVGYLPESPTFYHFLSGRELLRFYGRLSGLPAEAIAQRSADLLEELALTVVADRAIGTYSKGMLQRLGMAQALLHNPGLVILDEPSNGLDASGLEVFGTLVNRLRAEGKTVILASHLLGQMEDLCDWIVILSAGRIVLQGAVRALLTCPGRRRLTVDGWREETESGLREWLATHNVKLTETMPAARPLREVYREALTQGESQP